MPATDWRDSVSEAMGEAAAAKVEADGVLKTFKAAQAVWEADVDILYTTTGLLTISLNLAYRVQTFDVAAAQVGDRIQIFERARATLSGVGLVVGYSVQPHATVFDAGKIEVKHTIPAIGINSTLRIPLKLIAYRPAT